MYIVHDTCRYVTVSFLSVKFSSCCICGQDRLWCHIAAPLMHRFMRDYERRPLSGIPVLIIECRSCDCRLEAYFCFVFQAVMIDLKRVFATLNMKTHFVVIQWCTLMLLSNVQCVYTVHVLYHQALTSSIVS